MITAMTDEQTPPGARRDRPPGRDGRPTGGRFATHDLDLRDDVVVKRYRSWERQEPLREWEALTVLAVHAPGLAPAPVLAALDAEPPSVTMTRLPGIPLRGDRTTDDQVGALADALGRLREALPAAVVSSMRPAVWTPATAVAKARTWAAGQQPGSAAGPVVRKAHAQGTAWLAGPDPDELLIDPFPPVLGQGDGNRANYLWDAHDRRIRLLDWEDSGRSDRAFELGDLLEHVSRLDGDLDAAQLLDRIGLTRAERARVLGFRRLIAFTWFLLLGPEGPFAARNPAGSWERQAGRVLELLG
ncbi:aminoglycoside phosphotransferase family protein [Nonomuraea diastatica]|uniref:Aminoglycoside phosphotransferase family protein n=2 Tax=Nonomuraea diastatica TaxID=1848329 RepID=A0A4V2YFG7_9ACTN|nr:aminoglycoside phosphotransferase family protein [Nonomuraea diastatica]